MATIYCVTDLPEHEQINCEAYNVGGITEIILFNSDSTTTDPTNAATINADIASGAATHIRNIWGEVPEAAEKTQTNPVTNTPILLNFDQTLTWQDPNTTDGNTVFYNQANRFVAEKALFYTPLNDGVGRAEWIAPSSNAIRLMAKKTVPLSDGDFQRWMVTASWSDLDAPDIVATLPAGVFNQ